MFSCVKRERFDQIRIHPQEKIKLKIKNHNLTYPKTGRIRPKFINDIVLLILSKTTQNP